MTSVVKSLGLMGLNSYTVDVEADVSKGLPRFDIVGLPDAAVKESKDRVSAALKNCGYELPLKRITVNLAPADIKKSGPIYDLAILLSILISSEQLSKNLENSAFLGELSLSGEIREVNGVLPMAIKAKEEGIENLFVPEKNAFEASVVEGINIYGIKNVKELLDFILGITTLSPYKKYDFKSAEEVFVPDFSDVKGQLYVKRALEIAAAGGHNVLLVGSPGAGKSMLAKRMPSILPDLTFEESIEITKIYSIAGLLTKDQPLITKRPFRAPHHTISPAGLAGGGTIPHPGEISLAHNGVLFLDELCEFPRATMEILRQPIEDNVVTISRVGGNFTYPCSMMIIGAMNPCPCGYFAHPTRECICTPNKISNYVSRVSGPLLDRLDMHIDVLPLDYEQLSSYEKAETSAQIKERVNKARLIQMDRFKNMRINKFYCNAKISQNSLSTYCRLDDKANNLLKQAFERLSLSARAYDKIIKMARTIADLDQSEVILSNHIAEAIQYRSLDRKYWMPR